MDIPQETIHAFQEKILTWYRQHKRDLPWRDVPFGTSFQDALKGISLDKRAYKILVSEVMLQQTQVNRVIPKYEAWCNTFPTIEVLASATKADVLRLWSGLGYNRRALFLQKTAHSLVTQYNGKWPQTVEELKKLPGIGEYTSRAVACFAFDQQVAVVDTNVKKVILIEFADYGIVTSEKDFQHSATQLLPEGQAYEWNQALMDYASTVLKKEKIPIKKQSQFVGSNRYYRGKVLKYLLAHAQASEEDIIVLLRDTGTYSDNRQSSAILRSLEKEGFIVRDGKYLRLSE